MHEEVKPCSTKVEINAELQIRNITSPGGFAIHKRVKQLRPKRFPLTNTTITNSDKVKRTTTKR